MDRLTARPYSGPVSRKPLHIGYGTYVANSRDGPSQFRTEVQLAEEVGFDAIFFSEHHGLPGYAPAPLILAAMALAQTSYLRAGPMPLLLPLHDPVRIAEQAALADFVSEGRLILGLGAGYHPLDYEQIGVPIAERGSRMEEGIAILRNVWSEEPVLHYGRHFKVGTKNPLVHRPWHATGPPIWVGTGSHAGIRRAARFADGLVLGSVADFAAVAADAHRYRELSRDLGKEPGTVAVMRRAWIGAGEEIDQFIAALQRDYERHALNAGASGTDATRALQGVEITRQAVLDRAVAGSEDEVRDQIHALVDATGLDYLIIKFQWLQPNYGKVREQLERSGSLLARLNASAA